jgi:hypothetical protein
MGKHYELEVIAHYDGETCLNEALTSVIVYRYGQSLLRVTDDGRSSAITEAVKTVRSFRKRGEL